MCLKPICVSWRCTHQCPLATCVPSRLSVYIDDVRVSAPQPHVFLQISQSILTMYAPVRLSHMCSLTSVSLYWRNTHRCPLAICVPSSLSVSINDVCTSPSQPHVILTSVSLYWRSTHQCPLARMRSAVTSSPKLRNFACVCSSIRSLSKFSTAAWPIGLLLRVVRRISFWFAQNKTAKSVI